MKYTDWFLPSKDELKLMYTNLEEQGLGAFASDNYWSSSEGGDSAYDAWKQYFHNGYQNYVYRYYDSRVRPARAF